MAAIRFRRAKARALIILSLGGALLLGGSPAEAGRAPLGHTVIWHEDDRRPGPPPKPRDPNLLWDGITETALRPISRITNPGRLMRAVDAAFGGNPAQTAANVNALDEVPNSSWFTNRLGLLPLTPEEVARGPNPAGAPDGSRPFTVSNAKTQGVSPGFRITDARGREYFVRFDPKEYPGMSSRADAITTKILHACGYWVPDDFSVRFRREDLVLGHNVTLRDRKGKKRTMTEADLEDILRRVGPLEDGTWDAVASLKLPGTVLGPFDWQGRRADDPNDRIKHEDRRELRAFRIFAAWLGHYDTKQGNTLDTWLGTGAAGSVRHYVRDFGSTLGASAYGAYPRYNYEYSFDIPSIAGRALALGFHEDAWRRVQRPKDLPEVGYFGSAHFDPLEFKPLVPNSAFANLTRRDGYWAAKIISAFTDAHLESIVTSVGYRNPEATAYMARTLGERRDTIAKCFFDQVPPLDFFTLDGRVVRGHDLGAERNIYPGPTPRYRVRLARVNAERREGLASEWFDRDRCEFDLDPALYLVYLHGLSDDPAAWLKLEFQVNRGSGWSRSVAAYLDGFSKIVAVDR